MTDFKLSEWLDEAKASEPIKIGFKKAINVAECYVVQECKKHNCTDDAIKVADLIDYLKECTAK